MRADRACLFQPKMLEREKQELSSRAEHQLDGQKPFLRDLRVECALPACHLYYQE